MTEARHTEEDAAGPTTRPVESAQLSRAHQMHSVLAWVGIVAGVVFVVAVVFFSGFFIGRSSGGNFRLDRDRDGTVYPGTMYPGQSGPYGPMGPGMMGPGGTWGPYGPWTPGQPSPTTTAPSTPRS
jgi:hypothetical protein